jgi:hypothetical protein
MEQANYHTIFQIGLKSFPWSTPLHPIPFIVIALALIYLSRRKQYFKIVGSLIAVLGVMFLVILVLKLVPDFVAQRRPYVKGASSVVAGKIRDFHAAPILGPANESFTVNGVPFSYNVLDSSPCFHNAPAHKGPLHDGLDVRIYYTDECIQRVDVRE